jgi:F0F1-type ATP synthase assembly protein I
MLSLLGMGFYIAIAIVLGIWGGHWLDVKFNTSPLLLIIGLFFGIAVAALGVYNMIKPFMEEAKKADNNKKDKDIK